MGNKQMYIPLNVARDYIGKMSGETQNQFVIYVQGLKQHYVTKIISLRSVLDLHQKEISKKESYWEASIKSLQERNRTLLKEKTSHFSRFKEEVERLEKEKKDSITTWSAKLDWHQAKHAKMKIGAAEKEKNFRERERLAEAEKTKAEADWGEKLAELEAEKERLSESLREREEQLRISKEETRV